MIKLKLKFNVNNYNYMLSNINYYMNKFNKIKYKDIIYMILKFSFIVNNNINIYYYLYIFK